MASKTTESVQSSQPVYHHWFNVVLEFFQTVVAWIVSGYNNIKRRETGPWGVERKTRVVRRQHEPISRRITQFLLYNRVMEFFDTKGAVRALIRTENFHQGHTHMSPSSKKQIRPFVEFFNMDMSEFQRENPDDYETFNDFFTREIKPGKREIAAENDPTVAIVAADSRFVVFHNVEEAKQFWIKGRNFSIETLVDDRVIAQDFVNGEVVSFRLSPEDYHRYHSPVNGTVSFLKHVGGVYYGTDPYEIKSRLDVLTQNARTICIIDSKEFGKVLFVAIGAKDVGSVKFHPFMEKGHVVRKGDEMGLFQYGGSSILVAFQSNRIEFDADLVYWTQQRIEVHSKWGESLGRATRPSTQAVGSGDHERVDYGSEGTSIRKRFQMED